MRCIIGFFGLTRSLRHTAASIHAGIYAPLRRAGIPVIRAGHFNLPDAIDNPRSGERGIVPDRDEAGLLDLDLCWIERQAAENVAALFEIGQAFPDRFGDGYRSLENLCQQLRSLDRLWSLLQLAGVAEDDVVLLLRPDLLYVDALDPERDLRPIREGRADLVVPGWQSWGGLNDRFAFCNRAGAERYATRIYAFVDGCMTMDGMHAESLLHWVARRHRLRVAHTALRAVRIRADGSIAANDQAMLAAPVPVQSNSAA